MTNIKILEIFSANFGAFLRLAHGVYKKKDRNHRQKGLMMIGIIFTFKLDTCGFLVNAGYPFSDLRPSNEEI